MINVKLALIGAGMRGAYSYGPYTLEHPEQARFVAVAESDPVRRENFKKAHGLEDAMCFSDWNELLDKPKLADAILICTQDRTHYVPAIRALEKGYHVLLEKPMSPDALECIKLGEYAEKSNKIFLICHVLRYTNFFIAVKKLLDDERIGKLISIQHNENVGYWHQAHSFIRGNWKSAKESSPMILSKCCHDMDILLWLADSECENISSFGNLTHFKKENAPKGAPQKCLDGCPVEKDCPYHVSKIYMTENDDWPVTAITGDISSDGRMKALKEGPYGRCVYHCDNDVVDHQVVNFEFANEVTAAFTMCAFTKDCNRTLKLMGTKGEIRGVMEKNELEVIDFNTGKHENINIEQVSNGHGGGDSGIMSSFVKMVQEENTQMQQISIKTTVQSHIMAFAAEKSRLEKKVINIKEYIGSHKSIKTNYM